MTMNLKCIGDWDRCLPQPDELTPISQKLIPHELACAFNIQPSSSSSACTVATPSSDALHASHSAFKSLYQMRSILLPSPELERKVDAEIVPPLRQGKATDPDGQTLGIVQAVNEVNKQSLDVMDVKQGLRSGAALNAGALSSCALSHSYPSVSLLGPGLATGLSQLMCSASFMQTPAFSHAPESATADAKYPKEFLVDGRNGCGHSGGLLLESANPMQLKVDASEEADSVPSLDVFQGSSVTMSNEEQSARTLKKPRLVWTPQLHKRFVDAVAHLGIKHAVPKTIMQLMNVDGLTRENVASHLQKYRLYLKRMQGLSNDGPSASDQLFASTPVPPSLAASAHFLVSHHNQNADTSFVPVQNASLPSILGQASHHLTTGISSPMMSFSGVNQRLSFSSVHVPPAPPPLINKELGMERYMPQSRSAPGQILSLFPNSGK